MLARVMADFFYFRALTRKVEIRETGSQEMAEARPVENVRTNLVAKYQGLHGLKVCC